MENSTYPSKKNIITITKCATHKIKLLLNSRQPRALGIRIFVKSGGCSGFSYGIEYVDKPSNFDDKLTYRDFNIFIDKKAILFLIDTQIDYLEEKFKSGFVFINPKEKNRCGCGKSFGV